MSKLFLLDHCVQIDYYTWLETITWMLHKLIALRIVTLNYGNLQKILIIIYLHGAFNNFPDFFVWAFKIVVDSWQFTMLLLYIFWDDCLIFMISGSNEQLQQQLECTLLKPDSYSWGISKLQYGREDIL